MPSRPDRLTALAAGLELPPEAIADIEAYSARVAARYGVSTGPAPGEDE